ncbi:MAG: glutamate synthase-related protein, partial [Candidatus Gracilibacteria bacterium]
DDPEAYAKFLAEVRKIGPTYLRDLLKFKDSDSPIAVDEVGSVEEIIKEFFRASAMSHGALNGTAHMAIANAFNSFGAMSNSGEGGELKSRSRDGEHQDARSKIRQVASGRFGVDADYLVNADEIQIKIGQGAKPGEGGHLPSYKVTVEIAALRRTQPGVPLISPPPHHSIYSIEDLAQLIFNLKEVNPTAKLSVKVPAVTGLGTIAVGIAKAGADVIEISGFDGGTGAATGSAIEHAGIPLERGLAEVHQTLTENGIRQWVKLRADSGIKIGSDVAKLMAMGANEVNFGSALMIAEMCVMCKGCSKGKCPSGITSQDDEKFMQKAIPEGERSERYAEATRGIQNYLVAVAGELRSILADLGLKDPKELIGRVDLLEQFKSGNSRHDSVQLSPLLRDMSQFSATRIERADRQTKLIPHINNALNYRVMEMARSGADIELEVSNTDLAVGARLAGIIADKKIQVPENGFTIRLKGAAGQGLGFAATSGMNIYLKGFANDSVGEAMGGEAKIVIINPLKTENNSLVGNAACYGATGGTLYVDGTAGNRLGVRNSGATIITTGALKYAFEYMTGGTGIVLGEFQGVVAAGMTGGQVYCCDPQIREKIHAASVEVQPLEAVDIIRLKNLLTDYHKETGNEKARAVLALDNSEIAAQFVKIVPKKENGGK